MYNRDVVSKIAVRGTALDSLKICSEGRNRTYAMTKLMRLASYLCSTSHCELPTHAKGDELGFVLHSDLLTASEEVRSLTVAPHVYSQVPYEVFISCTDTCKYTTFVAYIPQAKTTCGFYAPFYKVYKYTLNFVYNQTS